MKPNLKLNSQNDAAQSSSQISSNLIYPLALDSRDRTKLDDIYDVISKNILELRNNKIILLEKYNHAISYRSVLQNKIKSLQKERQKKMEEERRKNELILKEILQKRQNARTKLKETIEQFEKSNNKNNQIDLTKPKTYITLVNERLNIEEKNIQIQKKIANQSSILSNQMLIEEIRRLKNKKNQLIKGKVDNKLIQFGIKLRNMNISQIKILIDDDRRKQKRQQFLELANRCKWQQQTTKDIEKFIQEQSQEKTNLFQQVYRVKQDMQQLQKACQSIQTALYDQNV